MYARTNQNEPVNGCTIDEQVETLKAHCMQQGKEIVGIFIDEGVSGIHLKSQHSLLKLLEEAKRGLFDEVLVWKIDRLARQTLDVLQTVDILEEHNVTFTSLHERFDASTRHGRFVLQMIAAAGEFGQQNL
ncbi:recombinase family protein [Paenibacillus sp. D51F]